MLRLFDDLSPSRCSRLWSSVLDLQSGPLLPKDLFVGLLFCVRLCRKLIYVLHSLHRTSLILLIIKHVVAVQIRILLWLRRSSGLPRLSMVRTVVLWTSDVDLVGPTLIGLELSPRFGLLDALLEGLLAQLLLGAKQGSNRCGLPLPSRVDDRMGTLLEKSQHLIG